MRRHVNARVTLSPVYIHASAESALLTVDTELLARNNNLFSLVFFGRGGRRREEGTQSERVNWISLSPSFMRFITREDSPV